MLLTLAASVNFLTNSNPVKPLLTLLLTLVNRAPDHHLHFGVAHAPRLRHLHLRNVQAGTKTKESGEKKDCVDTSK
jgi:hypothetical protein